MENNYLLKIFIKKEKKTVRSTGVVFYAYSTRLYLKEPKSDELVAHWVKVKFSSKVDSARLNCIKNQGYIYCNSEDVNAPEYYIVKDKKDAKGNIIEGKKEYPYVYINDFEKYEVKKHVAKQSQFVVDEADTEKTNID